MLETRSRPRTRFIITSAGAVASAGTVASAGAATIRGPRTRLELELRDVAEEIAGRLDRDELSRSEEACVEAAIDAAAAGALADVVAVLDRELTPRLEALPLATRLTLARARRRRDFGLD